jgi:cytochrome c oxidase cbb3-type subunit I/II
VGGLFYLTGMSMFGWNILMTWRRRPSAYAVTVVQAPRLSPRYVEEAGHPAPVPAGAFAGFVSMTWHRAWERRWVVFTTMTLLAVVIASLFEIIPTFLIRSNVPTIASVKPYTPLELAGRDLYIREGCFNCHSQMVRPFRHETERFGEYSKPGESVYDHPFLWGSRRIGPDLAREGGKFPDLWHVRHMNDPRSITAKSIMPPYRHLLTRQLDFDGIQRRVDVMAMLGVPYGEAVNAGVAARLAHEQATALAQGIEAQGGPAGLADKEITALVAYLQRLGKDIKAAPPAVAHATTTTGGGGQ